MRSGEPARAAAAAPSAPPSFEGLVTALINELAAQRGDGEVLLVLDDYHLIDAQPVHVSLGFLLEHLPPGLHLVLASRADPPLPLARLRAGGQLAELRAGDLRFSAEEAAALLRESAGADLPAAAVAALAARTEGWVAGLQLAALSLGGQADPAGFVAAFSGSHRYVLDYLAEEVLDRQQEELRTFLLETSVLERLSGGLCDAVTGRDGSQAMLERVEQAGLFLVPLDEVRGWWRYHHLFADLLRVRLQQQRPGRVPALHRAAAAWCEDHGLADDAVRHALAAGDAAWSMRLVERYADAFLLHSEGATLQRWLAALPAGLAGSRPRLLLAQAGLALLSHRVEAAEVALDAAERALLSSIAQGRAVGQSTMTAWGYQDLGRVQRAQGRLDAADGTYRQALEVAAATSRTALPAAGIAYVGLAEVAYQRNELDTALRHVSEGIGACRQMNFTQPLATGLATLAWIRQAQGDAAGAREAMEEAGRAAPGPGVVGLLNPVPAQRARLQLAQGDVAAAARWAHQRGLGPDDEPPYPREPEYLVLARVLLAQDRPGPALALLERLHAAAVSQNRAGSVIEIQALQALALAAAGEQTAAVDALAGALTLACPEGYVRVFADEGPPMAALLGALAAAHRAGQATARSAPLGCLARVLGTFGEKPAAPGAGRGAAAVVLGLAEPLTDRELEVLRLLAAGRPNQRIAHDLVVALDTVKKHVTHILGKLGAANRTEAVARARELGLIP